ncbi:MAG: formylglycine-generating enzyme family protein [Anaerolineae bacterium]|nr:formylglycine-generating enzyme family protein [Anaerolineae bacterium]
MNLTPKHFVLLCLRAFVLMLFLSLAACAAGDFPTPTPFGNLNVPPGEPGNPIIRNSDWTPVVQMIDEVQMVLVPVGCFNMGSNTGDADEQPIETQCFDRQFWIDRFEVSNAQFTQFNGVAELSSQWPDANRPRINIRWAEARDFCALRGARLPTEREWEYAARGPDGLIYPWGNDWRSESMVWPDVANGQTAEVGSRLGGFSWIGALDQVGNVWEWTSTLYDGFTYPYRADGRETPDDLTSQRVIRGGSWYDGYAYYARAANRARLGASIQDFNIGFRCVRDV